MNVILLLLACQTGEAGPSGLLGDEIAWAATFGGTASDEAWGVAALDDGGAILGTHQSAPDPMPDSYIYRLDAAGGVVWEARWGGSGLEKTFPVVVEGDVVYVGGTSYSTLSEDSAEGFVLALDLESGDELWEWVPGTDGYEEIDDIVPSGGSLYISGWSTGTSRDALVGELTTEGETVWLGGFDSGGWDEANGGLVVTEEAMYITGIRDGTGFFSGGTGMIASFDLTGGLNWTVDLPGCTAYCDGLGLASDGAALYTVGMAVEGLATSMDLHAFDLDGESLWDTRWIGDGAAYGRAIDVRDGTIRVAGTTNGGGGDDIVVLELDAASGQVGQHVTWAGFGRDVAHEIAVTDTAVFVAGQTTSWGAGATDALLLKIPLDLSEPPPVE